MFDSMLSVTDLSPTKEPTGKLVNPRKWGITYLPGDFRRFVDKPECSKSTWSCRWGLAIQRKFSPHDWAVSNRKANIVVSCKKTFSETSELPRSCRCTAAEYLGPHANWVALRRSTQFYTIGPRCLACLAMLLPNDWIVSNHKTHSLCRQWCTKNGLTKHIDTYFISWHIDTKYFSLFVGRTRYVVFWEVMTVRRIQCNHS